MLKILALTLLLGASFSGVGAASPAKPARARFLVLGDSGTGASGQYRVAEAMHRVCAERGCDFALNAGDDGKPHLAIEQSVTH